MKNKYMGVNAGVPDYMVIIPDKISTWKLVFIEMKRAKSGKVSPQQEEWIKDLKKVNNVYAYVCYGFADAKNCIDNLCW
jgi:hypothetical protein